MTIPRQKIDTTRLPEQVTHKWSADLLAEGFVPLPKMFLRTMSIVVGDLGMDAVQAVLSIIDFDRPNLRQQPSMEYLAFNAGLPIDRFKECLKALIDAGYAERVDDSSMDEWVHVSLKGLKDAIAIAAAKQDAKNGKEESEENS